jgi:threonine dehydrogenase-like Zn-dependent dehydrogenase
VKALVFGEFPDPMPPSPPADAPPLLHHLASTPMVLKELPDPRLLGPDWLVLKTRLTGICGSDTKQVLMDFEGAADSPMTAFISFPQVLGHEVVATVEDVGPAARGFDVGQRVVLNPWLSCAPRGITPECEWCQAGDWNLCAHFNEGRLSPGIHTGNATEATGGFADRLPAHTQMAIPVPDGVPDEVAVLGDPFSVSLHAITRNPPPPGGRVLVYGAGALGSTATAILRSLYPSVDVATIARWDGQATLAAGFGAKIFRDDGRADIEPRIALIEALAEWSGGVVRHPWEGLPVTHPGGIDVVYDTVGSMETIEVGVRVLRERGVLVQLGVSSMKRCEFTPLYFKELRMIGSSAFGIEEIDGKRQHAIAHYLDLVSSGRIDVSSMLTHTFRLDEWRDAFTTIVDQGRTGAVKVAFDFR